VFLAMWAKTHLTGYVAQLSHFSSRHNSWASVCRPLDCDRLLTSYPSVCERQGTWYHAAKEISTFKNKYILNKNLWSFLSYKCLQLH
jgi:hypothetical protein